MAKHFSRQPAAANADGTRLLRRTEAICTGDKLLRILPAILFLRGHVYPGITTSDFIGRKILAIEITFGGTCRDVTLLPPKGMPSCATSS